VKDLLVARQGSVISCIFRGILFIDVLLIAYEEMNCAENTMFENYQSVLKILGEVESAVVITLL